MKKKKSNCVKLEIVYVIFTLALAVISYFMEPAYGAAVFIGFTTFATTGLQGRGTGSGTQLGRARGDFTNLSGIAARAYDEPLTPAEIRVRAQEDEERIAKLAAAGAQQQRQYAQKLRNMSGEELTDELKRKELLTPKLNT